MGINTNKPFFRHFVIELECPFSKANSLEWIKEKISLFIDKLDIHALTTTEYLFNPQGISLIYIISSSHLSVHTWPENDYIHIDLLTCSDNHKLNELGQVVQEIFLDLPCKVKELDYIYPR